MDRIIAGIFLCVICAAAQADWSAGNPEVTKVAKPPAYRRRTRRSGSNRRRDRCR
jgi:hypothetical protein